MDLAERLKCSLLEMFAQWNTPYRIRHAATNKYLSVESSSAVAGLAAVPGSAVRARHLSREEAREETREDAREGAGGPVGAQAFFETSLVEDVDPAAAPGAFGSQTSMLFFLAPTDFAASTLKVPALSPPPWMHAPFSEALCLSRASSLVPRR